jgi:hypothetical protein
MIQIFGAILMEMNRLIMMAGVERKLKVDWLMLLKEKRVIIGI